MERLTYRNSSGEVHVKCREKCTDNEVCNPDICLNRKILNRLAEYEDLEVTPEQIREIDKICTKKMREVAELQKLCVQCMDFVETLADECLVPHLKEEEMQLNSVKDGMFCYKGICRICGNGILEAENYCSQCGQKVKK